MLTGYYQKIKEKLSKRLVKGNKLFLKKKKTKRVSAFVSDIETCLKKKKKTSVIMIVNI